MSTGGRHRITLVLAVGLVTLVTVAMYVVRVHALRVQPGLLIVHVGWVAPWAASAVTVTVRRHERMVAHAVFDPDARVVIVPDLGEGTYRVSIAVLDWTLAQKTITVGGDAAARWVQTVALPLPPPPSDTYGRELQPSRSDSTNRRVAQEVYALVIAHLTAQTGNRTLLERETAHSGFSGRSAAHSIVPLGDSIRLALREPSHRQVVWHHAGIFPPTVMVINRADVPRDLEGVHRWKSKLGLSAEQRLQVLSLSRVFVSDDETQALVFGHDRGSRGDLFLLKRATSNDAWTIDRVDLLWIS